MPYSPVQANKSDQPAASRQVKPVNLSPSSIFKVYAKLNLRIDSCHGEKPNNALNARCLVHMCFKTDTFREPTLATGCKYSKKLFCTKMGKGPQYSEVRRVGGESQCLDLDFMDTEMCSHIELLTGLLGKVKPRLMSFLGFTVLAV